MQALSLVSKLLVYNCTDMSSLWIMSLAFFLFIYIVISTISTQSKSPSSKLVYHPIIGNFISFYKNRYRLVDWYTHLLSISPTQTITISRIGARRTVVTTNPKNVEHILKTNFQNYPKGKPFTDVLGDLLGSGIFNTDGDLWFEQRKLASHEFSARSMRELVYVKIGKVVEERLLPFLEGKCKDGKEFDLQKVFRRFAFDVICSISMGYDFGLLDPLKPMDSHDLPFATAFDIASAVSARRGAAPISAIWKIKRALKVGSEHKLHTAVTQINETINTIIQQRKRELFEKEDENTSRNDLLSKLIKRKHSDKQIRDMVISFMMAGRDTTSSALTWFFYLLSLHPAIENEVLEEVTKKHKDYESLKEMKYVEACLYESMRLYPPVVWDSKHAEREDVLPDGTEVGKGDRVTYFQYGMGRMERIWGEDCKEFKPRRWLLKEEDGRDQMVKVSAYKYAVFQGGPRVCLGKDMAMMEMRYVVAKVLEEYVVRRVGDAGVVPVMVPLLTAHMAGGLNVVVARRKS